MATSADDAPPRCRVGFMRHAQENTTPKMPSGLEMASAFPGLSKEERTLALLAMEGLPVPSAMRALNHILDGYGVAERNGYYYVDFGDITTVLFDAKNCRYFIDSPEGI